MHPHPNRERARRHARRRADAYFRTLYRHVPQRVVLGLSDPVDHDTSQFNDLQASIDRRLQELRDARRKSYYQGAHHVHVHSNVTVNPDLASVAATFARLRSATRI